MEETLTLKEPLFQILDEGQKKLSFIKEKGILLVGDSRVGKSTLINWIMGKPLEAVSDDSAMPVYKLVVNAADSARIGDGMESVTLVPNIQEVANKDYFIGDMAGYFDERDYKGVIGVSYMLKALFKRVRFLKFIIVIEENSFKASKGDGFRNTLTAFMSMFHIHRFSEELRKKLFSSVSFLITKSQTYTRHEGYMKAMMQNLMRANIADPYKQFHIELLKEILDSDRRDYFELANVGTSPTECRIIQKYEDRNWKYFDLEDQINLAAPIEKDAKDMIVPEIRQRYINLPFKKDFIQLQKSRPGHQQLFKKDILNRLKSYNGFANLIKVLLNHCLDNWETPTISFNVFYKEVKVYLSNFDVYKTESSIKEEELSVNPKFSVKLDLGHIILEIVEICNAISEQFGDQYGSFQTSMNKIEKRLSQIMDKLKEGFCSNKDEEKLICRLKIVAMNGIREFSTLYQIADDLVATAPHAIKDSLNDYIGQISDQFVRQKFISCGMSLKKLRRIFPTLPQLIQYDSFVLTYQEKYPSCADIKYIVPLRLNIKDLISKAYIKDQQYKPSLSYLLEQTHQIQKYEENIFSIPEDQKQESDLVVENGLFVRKLGVYSDITFCLQKLNTIESLRLALDINIEKKDSFKTSEVFQCIENYILEHQDQINQEQRKIKHQQIVQSHAGEQNADELVRLDDELQEEIYQPYFLDLLNNIEAHADYCYKNGMPGRAIELMQKRLSSESKMFLEYQRVKQKLSEMACQFAAQLENYYRENAGDAKFTFTDNMSQLLKRVEQISFQK